MPRKHDHQVRWRIWGSLASNALASLHASLGQLHLHGTENESNNPLAVSMRMRLTHALNAGYLKIESLGGTLRPSTSTLKCVVLECCYLPASDGNFLNTPGFFARFPNLQTLQLREVAAAPAFTSLDLSGCTALTNLECVRCNLLVMDITSCTALFSLDCTKNRLRALDLSHSSRLHTLTCSNNSLLSHLNLSACSGLVELDSWDNNLHTILFAAGAQLRKVRCENSQNLDFGGVQVADLCCKNMLFKSWSRDQRLLLQSLTVQDAAENLEGFRDLKFLSCMLHDSTPLDLRGCKNVQLTCKCEVRYAEILGCGAVSKFKLTSQHGLPGNLRLSDFISVTELDLSWDWIEVDLSACLRLRKLSIHHTDLPLRLLHLTGCPALEELHVNGHQNLEIFEISKCPKLASLHLSGSDLSNLDLSCCPGLSFLDVSCSLQLRTISHSNCTMLDRINSDFCPQLSMEFQVREKAV